MKTKLHIKHMQHSHVDLETTEVVWWHQQATAQCCFTLPPQRIYIHIEYSKSPSITVICQTASQEAWAKWRREVLTKNSWAGTALPGTQPAKQQQLYRLHQSCLSCHLKLLPKFSVAKDLVPANFHLEHVIFVNSNLMTL